MIPDFVLGQVNLTQGTTRIDTSYDFYTKGLNQGLLELTVRNDSIFYAEYDTKAFASLPEQLYVNHAATGANNGTSWADAYTDLDDALTYAGQGDEIWVAQGIYHPGGANPTDSSSFSIQDGVALYGGFDGTETMRSQQDYENNITLLSGDMLENDPSGELFFAAGRTDNVRHIMIIDTTVTQSTIIDGFRFVGGHTDDMPIGNGDNMAGGAIRCSGTPYLANNYFEYNFGISGGAIAIAPSLTNQGMVLDNCHFDSNVGLAIGGAIITAQHITLNDCTFDQNKSTDFGGAIVIGGAGIDIETCDFTNNEASYGGAITAFGFHFAPINILSSTFSDNSAEIYGGAVNIQSFFGNTNITNCVFTGNSAFSTDVSNTFGGAIMNFGQFNIMTISDSEFSENYAGQQGGAITNTGVLDIYSSIFEDNIAENAGGVISNYQGSSIITNSLMVGNSADNEGLGGALINYTAPDSTAFPADITIINSTIAENEGDSSSGVFQSGLSTLTFANTILSHNDNNYNIGYGNPSVVSLGGNISNDGSLVSAFTHAKDQNNTDPQFADVAFGDFHLQSTSPAREAGVATYAPLFDLDGMPRVDSVDAGAYEFPFPVNTTSIRAINNSLTTFPNPVAVSTTLEINNDWLGDVLIQVIDVTGKVLDTRTIVKNNTLHQEKITVKDLPAGQYLFLVTQGEVQGSVRFIKL